MKAECALRPATSGSGLSLTGNGLPSTPTGTYPVQASDPAYQYDRNPNSIQSWDLRVTLPANPTVQPTASCVGGLIGFSVLGVPVYSAFDAEGRDANAHEVQDGCDGHPQRDGHYHFHSLSRCYTAPAGYDAGLFGYALDGFGIYGPHDYNPYLAKIACHRLGVGVDHDAAASAHFLSINLPRGTTQVQTYQFLGSAIAQYCPDLQGKLQNIPGT